uniref:Cytochrome P450 n=2 Tax=Fusarium oxysporum (strain Fo5176) TaxID=660025 RepID=A0A0D2YKA6_FUSOF
MVVLRCRAGLFSDPARSSSSQLLLCRTVQDCLKSSPMIEMPSGQRPHGDVVAVWKRRHFPQREPAKATAIYWSGLTPCKGSCSIICLALMHKRASPSASPQKRVLSRPEQFAIEKSMVHAMPEVVTGSFARIRAEAENAAVVEEKNGKRSATFNIAEFEESMPLLVGCYRETLRLVNQTLSTRRILQDTSVTTPEGATYILKKDTDLQLPAGVAHYEDSVWGADVNVFNPERFLPSSKGSTEDERKRKAAYIPFGGGRHLCPGRNLA